MVRKNIEKGAIFLKTPSMMLNAQVNPPILGRIYTRDLHQCWTVVISQARPCAGNSHRSLDFVII